MGDFSGVSLEELEDMVAENEIKIMQQVRHGKARSRSRGAEVQVQADIWAPEHVQNGSQGAPSRSPSPPKNSANTSGDKKKVKRVTVVEDNESQAQDHQQQ